MLAAGEKIEPAVKEVTLLLAAGAIFDNVAEEIAQYGPTIQHRGAYFDGARVCLVSGG